MGDRREPGRGVLRRRGSARRPRTLFAVGDEKQSIYSFQGADPARFGAVGRAFQQRARAVGLDWQEVPLTLSFRSTEPILKAVDRVFAKPARHGARVGREVASSSTTHPARAKPGWSSCGRRRARKSQTHAEPFEPWDEATTGARSVDELCRRIARTIKGWLNSEAQLLSEGRPIKAGDFMNSSDQLVPPGPNGNVPNSSAAPFHST